MTEYSLIESIFFLLVMIFLASFFSSWIAIALTLDRRLNSLFATMPEIHVISFGPYRTPNYAFCVVFKNRSKKDRIMLYHYGGFDFRGFATSFEIVVSTIFVTSFITLLTLCIIGFIADLFGVIRLG